MRIFFVAALLTGLVVRANADPEVVRIKNAWETDDSGSRADAYLHIEKKLRLEASPIEQDWQSAMWTFEPIEGTKLVRIRNHWKSDRYIHLEKGKLSAGPIDTSWQSAVWELESVDGGAMRIRSHWQRERYLNVQGGKLAASKIKRDWMSARWLLQPI